MFTFDLPDELIAQQPAHPRDAARLLVYDRKNRTITDTIFSDILNHLPSNTTLAINNTRVDKCRLVFGKLEIFALQTHNPTMVTAMVRPGKKFKLGAEVALSDGLTATVINIDGDGLRTLTLTKPLDDPVFDGFRQTPFPPYIHANESLASEYQTVYADQAGSKAAPTAGLHFTDELMAKTRQKHAVAEVNLEVGLGTFASLKPENFATNSLHQERYHISDESADTLNAAKDITAVGTTTVRTLESYRAQHNNFTATDAVTDIFITPGFTFKAVDHMVTNFHLPGTSLLYLVSAFIGSEAETERIYLHAIKHKYRFYSFGDAMLIL